MCNPLLCSVGVAWVWQRSEWPVTLRSKRGQSACFTNVMKTLPCSCVFSNCFCDHKVWLHSLSLSTCRRGAWPILVFVLEPRHPKRRFVDPLLMEDSFIRKSHDYQNCLFCIRFRRVLGYTYSQSLEDSNFQSLRYGLP
jgi:hypothetical protein